MTNYPLSVNQTTHNRQGLPNTGINNHPKTTAKKYLPNPFNTLYQDDFQLSKLPEIQELNQYALDLDDQIEGDFDLDWIEFEFANNRLAYVRNGLILAKLKFMKLYKNWGDGTFASFCRERLRITRWQVKRRQKTLRYKGRRHKGLSRM